MPSTDPSTLTRWLSAEETASFSIKTAPVDLIARLVAAPAAQSGAATAAAASAGGAADAGRGALASTPPAGCSGTPRADACMPLGRDPFPTAAASARAAALGAQPQPQPITAGVVASRHDISDAGGGSEQQPATALRVKTLQGSSGTLFSAEPSRILFEDRHPERPVGGIRVDGGGGEAASGSGSGGSAPQQGTKEKKKGKPVVLLLEEDSAPALISAALQALLQYEREEAAWLAGRRSEPPSCHARDYFLEQVPDSFANWYKHEHKHRKEYKHKKEGGEPCTWVFKHKHRIEEKKAWLNMREKVALAVPPKEEVDARLAYFLRCAVRCVVTLRRRALFTLPVLCPCNSIIYWSGAATQMSI